MDQLRDYADDRLMSACVYCGGNIGTKDHVPSRVFLDKPYPTNLPVVPCCLACNRGFSLDEEYLAAFIESAISGAADPELIRRPWIARILRRSPALAKQIQEATTTKDGKVQFLPDQARVTNVLLKLARGRAAFEFSSVCREDPSYVLFSPLDLLSVEGREEFESALPLEMFGEAGSRGLQRAFVTEVLLRADNGETRKLGAIFVDWVDVQEGRYRYIAIGLRSGILVRFVFSEYLACEVFWGLESILKYLP